MTIQVPVQEEEKGRLLQQQRIARLRAYKESLNYTFKDIAEKSGVPESTVKKVLTGATKNPRRKTVEQMEKALGIKDTIEEAIERNGRLHVQAPSSYVVGTSAEKLEDMVPEVEAAVTRHMRAKRNSEDGSSQRLYTVKDYFELPQERRAELIDGVFYDMAAPTTIHQYIVVKMVSQIDAFIGKRKGKCVPYVSPVAVQLDDDDFTMVEPDLVIVCDHKKITSKCIKGAPDFVCEVLSPSNKYADRLRKEVKYLDAGVREYWEIDPEKGTVTVYSFGDESAEPVKYALDGKVPVSIYNGKLKIDFKSIAEYIKTFGV